MTGEEKPKRKKRRALGIAFSLVSFSVLTYIAIALIFGRSPDFSWFTGLFSPRAPVVIADEYHFDVGRDRVFADLGGPITAAGTLGIQVLDPGGSESLRDTFRMSVPAISATEGRAIAYDIGGTAVRVFNASGIIASFDASGDVVSASINKNGWFCVSTQEGGGYRGVVTVYNDSGNPVFRAFLSSGYVLSAVLSPDNRSLAILNLTDGGSRITFYHGLNKDIPDNTFDLHGELIIDILYLANGNMLAVSTNSLIIVDKDGASRELFEYFDKRLGGYGFDDGFISLNLLDYGVGYRGRLVTVDKDGNLLGEYPTDREIISMSCGRGLLAVLRNDGLMVFDYGLESVPLSGDDAPIAGAGRVLVLDSGVILAAGDHSAIVYRTSER